MAKQDEAATMLPNYNENSRLQSQALQLFKPFLESAVAALSPDLSSSDSPFVIADFGCSTGLNSSDAVSHVISQVRNKYAGERCSSVLLVLNDLPRNHWSELFGFLHGDERSVLNKHKGVFAVASGKTFYEQVLPSKSLHMGISNICVHWCSQLPARISDHCFYMFAAAEEHELFRQQAASDWRSFLAARSRELVSGGVLAATVVTPQSECAAIFQELYASAKALLSRGVIEQEELLDFNIGMYFRTVEEVSDRQLYEALGLELLAAEKFPLSRSVHYQEFLQHGSAQRFALDFSQSRAVVYGASLRGALGPARSEEQKAAIIREFWVEYQTRIAAQPASFQYTWNSIAVVIRKR